MTPSDLKYRLSCEHREAVANQRQSVCQTNPLKTWASIWTTITMKYLDKAHLSSIKKRKYKCALDPVIYFFLCYWPPKSQREGEIWVFQLCVECWAEIILERFFVCDNVQCFFFSSSFLNLVSSFWSCAHRSSPCRHKYAGMTLATVRKPTVFTEQANSVLQGSSHPQLGVFSWPLCYGWEFLI